MNIAAVGDGGFHNQLIGLVAHELRYPLSPIRNAATLLKHESLDSSSIRRAADTIERQTGVMLRLISDLVDVSRMQLGPIDLHCERLSLAQLMDRAVDSVGSIARDRGLTLSLSVASQTIYLDVDVLRVCQALHNVIDNAARYTEKPGSIFVRAQREGSKVSLAVSDTGAGIAAEDLEHIFGLYARSSQGGRIEPGLGLGLYITRNLIEAHGGSVTAFSDGRGSTFTLRLPCELASARALLPGEAASAGDPFRA